MKIKGLQALALSVSFLFMTSTAYAANVSETKGQAAKHDYKVSSKKDMKYEREDDRDDDDEDDDDDREYAKGQGKYKAKGPKDQDKKDKAKKDKAKKEYIHVKAVTLNTTSTTIEVGAWERLVATVSPANAKNKLVVWNSSNPKIASVNPSGKVTGLKPGTVTIYGITCDGLKIASCTVTVVNINETKVPVTGVTLNKSILTLAKGTQETLTSTITPANATDKKVKWYSSNTSVVTVDANGRVTAKNPGTAVVYVQTNDGNKGASCVVTVTDEAVIRVTAVNLNKSYLELKEGYSETLVATLSPSNATNKAITWWSSDTTVATVDSTGKVVALKPGVAVIRVTTNDGGKTASCVISVKESTEAVPVTGVSLNQVNLTMPVGMSEQLRFLLNPTNASNKEVRWTTSDATVATVTYQGEIVAKGLGTVTIKVATVDGNKQAECQVTVVPALQAPAEGILLNKLVSTIAIGATDYPIVKIYPSGTATQTLTWTSSNTSVATVNQKGEVTGIAKGTSAITVKTQDNKTVSYLVIVVEK